MDISFYSVRRIIFVLIAILTITTNSFSQKKQPNIVFILADDLGYGDLGRNGQRYIRTPHIDKLANQGVTFPNFYSGATVCAPSRSALLTGHHTGHTFIRGNKEIIPEGQFPLADSVVTFVELLKQEGYTTAAFGKWGLGMVGTTGDPTNQGFDYFYGYNCQRLAHRYYPSHLWENQKKVNLPANGNLEFAETFGPDMIQDKTLEYIDLLAKKEQPFFLYIPSVLPHAELLVPHDSIYQSYVGQFEEKPFKGNDYGPEATDAGYASQQRPRAAFAAMVTRLDLHVGQIVERLKVNGLEDNTIIVFTSDNGPHQEGGADPDFFNSGAGLRGYKRDLYDGGIHVPFIVKWPGVVKANSTNAYLGAFWDMFPTFTELAGVKKKTSTDGISLVRTLKGKSKQKEHEYLYWEFHEQGGKQAIRKGNWKGIRLNVFKNPDGDIELYNLSVDKSEHNNIAKNHPEVVAEIKQLMKKARTKNVNFPFGKE